MYARKKRPFGAILPARNDSEGLRIDITYFKVRLRYPSRLPDTAENREILRNLLDNIYSQIQEGAFKFADTFPNAPVDQKYYFTRLEDQDYRPLPSEVNIGDYVRSWFEKWLVEFNELDKKDYYASAIRRILPVFEHYTFNDLTTDEVERFFAGFTVQRGKNRGNHASKNRKKNVLYVFKRIWSSVCGQYGWNISDPFVNVSNYIEELDMVQRIKRATSSTLEELICDNEMLDSRKVFLLREWRRLLECIKPFYRPVTEFLVLTMMIGSEIEGLPKACVTGDYIRVRVKRDKSGRILPMLKNGIRKRQIRITKKLRVVIDAAMTQSSDSEFLFVMEDGSPFNYRTYYDDVWAKAVEVANIEHRVAYSTRHTGIAWHMLLKVDHERLISITGHADKGMIYGRYGKYREGLYEEREEILAYLGADTLIADELNAFKAAGFRDRENSISTSKEKATFCRPEDLSDNFSDKKWLYSDNY